MQRPTAKHWAELGNPAEREKGLYEPGVGVKDIAIKPTKQLNGLIVTHSLDQQPGSLYGTNLGPLHVSDSWVTWSACGTPSREGRDCP